MEPRDTARPSGCCGSGPRAAQFRRGDGEWRASLPMPDLPAGWKPSVDRRVYHAEDGTPTRIAGVVADVTEQRRIEVALQQAQRLQAVGTIAGGVAHNFNNLLAVVLGNLDLASRSSSDAERVRLYLEAATAAAERGAKLTWQLLSFARQQP